MTPTPDYESIRDHYLRVCDAISIDDAYQIFIGVMMIAYDIDAASMDVRLYDQTIVPRRRCIPIYVGDVSGSCDPVLDYVRSVYPSFDDPYIDPVDDVPVPLRRILGHYMMCRMYMYVQKRGLRDAYDDILAEAESGAGW